MVHSSSFIIQNDFNWSFTFLSMIPPKKSTFVEKAFWLYMRQPLYTVIPFDIVSQCMNDRSREGFDAFVVWGYWSSWCQMYMTFLATASLKLLCRLAQKVYFQYASGSKRNAFNFWKFRTLFLLKSQGFFSIECHPTRGSSCWPRHSAIVLLLRGTAQCFAAHGVC